MLSANGLENLSGEQLAGCPVDRLSRAPIATRLRDTALRSVLASRTCAYARTVSTYRYVVADVFTDTPLEGNQLAVFTDAREIPED